MEEQTINTNTDLMPKNLEPVSIKQWIYFALLSLINVVPFLGFILYLAAVAYIAFKSKYPESLKNFCKAYLIVLAVIMILALVFMWTVGFGIIALAILSHI